MPEGNGLNFVVVGHVWAGVIGRAVGVYTVWIWSSRGIYIQYGYGGSRRFIVDSQDGLVRMVY